MAYWLVKSEPDVFSWDDLVKAGKTGTAQKVTNGVYGKERISSFVGFLPADRPEIAIAVSVDSPTIGSKYGGIVAAPVFSEIGAFTMRYLGVEPDPNVTFKAPHLGLDEHGHPTGEPVEEAPHVVVSEAEPPPPLPPIEVVGDHEGGWVMPDLSGRTLRAALAGLDGTGLVLDVSGYGTLVAQSPAPGSPVRAGERVTLHFD